MSYVYLSNNKLKCIEFQYNLPAHYPHGHTEIRYYGNERWTMDKMLFIERYVCTNIFSLIKITTITNSTCKKEEKLDTCSFSASIRTIFQLVATCLPINRLETRETRIFGCPSVVRDVACACAHTHTHTYIYTYPRHSSIYRSSKGGLARLPSIDRSATPWAAPNNTLFLPPWQTHPRQPPSALNCALCQPNLRAVHRKRLSTSTLARPAGRSADSVPGRPLAAPQLNLLTPTTW